MIALKKSALVADPAARFVIAKRDVKMPANPTVADGFVLDMRIVYSSFSHLHATNASGNVTWHTMQRNFVGPLRYSIR